MRWCAGAHYAVIEAGAGRRAGGDEADAAGASYTFGYFCPDHFFISSYSGIESKAAAKGAETLIVETAGLCGRCSPFMKNAAGVAAFSLLESSKSPQKAAPLINTADAVVFTGADLVSPTEKRVCAALVRKCNPAADIYMVDALTGEGIHRLAARLETVLEGLPDNDGQPPERMLRASPPKFLCSYCFGRDDVGAFRL